MPDGLAAASVLARKFEGDNPVLIYLPEVAFDQEQFLADVQKAFEHTSNLVVCISEGINDGNGKFVCELASDVGVDTFGHKMLTGSGKYLENLVKDRLGVKVAPSSSMSTSVVLPLCSLRQTRKKRLLPVLSVCRLH